MDVVEKTNVTELMATGPCCFGILFISAIGSVGIHHMRASERMNHTLLALFSVCVCSADLFCLTPILYFNADEHRSSLWFRLGVVALASCALWVYLCLLATLIVRYVMRQVHCMNDMSE